MKTRSIPSEELNFTLKSWKFLFCCQLASDRPSATVTWQMLAHNRQRELFLISLMILKHLTVFYVWTFETPLYLANSRLFWHCISHQKTHLNCSNFKVNDCKGEIIFPPKAWRVSLYDTNSAWRNLPNERPPLLLRCFLLLRLTSSLMAHYRHLKLRSVD